MTRVELELRFILDVSKPVSSMEREAMINMLEAAEDYRATKGIMESPDISRARLMLNGHPGVERRALPTMHDIQQAVLVAALQRHHGNRTHAARELGVTVRTIRNRVRRDEITVPAGACVHDERGEPL